ncbi:MAG: glycerophosphodiester phosphodiesterase [Planctomycetales bacterium]|nr:glycerophosphodiester phosphodiesterase [Planctomycetales bacterium]
MRFSISLLVAILIVSPWCATESSAQRIIAHRGASHAAPENTLAAFRLAWELGADGIEGDFYLSSDGKIVCIHDRDTERVAGVKKVVADTSFADLRRLDVGRWKDESWEGERIPTLEEVLATAPRGKLVFIELKCGPEIVDPLVATLDLSTVPHENIVIISFNADVIAACEEKLPHLKSYWLTSYKQNDGQAWRPTATETSNTIRRIHADGLGSQAEPNCFDGAFINQLREGGVSDFHVWTVDDPILARQYLELGAWSITTNRPRYLRRELSKTK